MVTRPTYGTQSSASASWSSPGRHPRIGILYPCSGTRDGDFWRLAPAGASVHVTRLPFASVGTREDVMTMSSDENLRAGALLLSPVRPHAVAWADTSGSFLFGPAGDAAQVALLADVTGAIATTTSTALLAACAALGVSTVDIASPYLTELNDALVDFLGEHDVGVGRIRALELESSYDIASVPSSRQRELITAAAGDGDAVLVPCTDFFALELLQELEDALERPVIAANAATMWHLRHLLGIPVEPSDAHGLLFSTEG